MAVAGVEPAKAPRLCVPLGGSGDGGGMNGPAGDVRAMERAVALPVPHESTTVPLGSTETSVSPLTAKYPMDGRPPLKRFALLGRQDGQVTAPRIEICRSFWAAA